MRPTQNNHRRYPGEQGIAALELALILPLLIIMAFVIIDFGRLIQARLVVTNLAREGGSLASRDIQSAGNLITMLQAGASPLNLAADGRIYIWKIRAGTTAAKPGPLHRPDRKRERRGLCRLPAPSAVASRTLACLPSCMTTWNSTTAPARRQPTSARLP